MNFELLTPHQFEEYTDYVDTVLVCGDTGMPLDVASPQTAARLISRQLAYVLLERFRGRTSLVDVASGMWFGYDVAHWATVAQEITPYAVKYGILITDRQYLNDKSTVNLEASATRWLIFDWYQWLRQRIPEGRLVDSYLYLCMASDLYRSSPECRTLGVSAPDGRVMASEGRRILEIMSSELIDSVTDLWEQEDQGEGIGDHKSDENEGV